MSAHCNTCGTDLVHVLGDWPAMECPVCKRDDEIARLVEVLRRIADGRPPESALTWESGKSWRIELARQTVAAYKGLATAVAPGADQQERTPDA